MPIVLFSGTPGTGKTYAMRFIAAEAKLSPTVLRLRGTELWESEFLEILPKISQLEVNLRLNDGEHLFLDHKVTDRVGPKYNIIEGAVQLDVRSPREVAVLVLWDSRTIHQERYAEEASKWCPEVVQPQIHNSVGDKWLSSLQKDGYVAIGKATSVPALAKHRSHAIGTGQRRIVVPWFVGCCREGH